MTLQMIRRAIRIHGMTPETLPFDRRKKREDLNKLIRYSPLSSSISAMYFYVHLRSYVHLFIRSVHTLKRSPIHTFVTARSRRRSAALSSTDYRALLSHTQLYRVCAVNCSSGSYTRARNPPTPTPPEPRPLNNYPAPIIHPCLDLHHLLHHVQCFRCYARLWSAVKRYFGVQQRLVFMPGDHY